MYCKYCRKETDSNHVFCANCGKRVNPISGVVLSYGHHDVINAFSVFVAQNFGANKMSRIKSGIKQAVISVAIFSAVVSVIVFSLSGVLMSIFVDGSNVQTIEIGSQYLQIEGACYIGIGILFMLYGYYRAVNKPFMSVVLTVISLGTRVLLSLVLSKIPQIGVTGIWLSIPIGWFLADAFGVVYYLKSRNSQQI